MAGGISILQHIGFDSSVRLPGTVYYFEYQGVRFKLVQNNPRKFANHLLTIIGDHDEPARSKAFRAAAGFLSAWAFDAHAAVMLWDSGGSGRAVFPSGPRSRTTSDRQRSAGTVS